MKLTADFHSHSRYSRFNHGKDTIEEMVHQANELGLKEFAITDHGYKNFFGTSKEKMKRARKVIDDINVWSKTKILLGIEADLLNTSGDIDIDEETLELIDILIVGYHRMIKTDFAGYFGNQRKSQNAIDKATNAYIHAIETYPITILSHLDSVLTTDLYRIGCACRENGVMVEINNRHLNWSKEQIEALIKSDCMFVVNSDAHCRDDVGVVNRAIDFIKKYNIPSQNIANMEFTEDEMTIEDLENNVYYDIYQQRLKQQKDRMSKSNIKNGGGKLSKEMEDALQQIANEQGIKDYQRSDKEITPEDILSDEKFLREAELAVSDLKAMIDTQNKMDNGYYEETNDAVNKDNEINENQSSKSENSIVNSRETIEFNDTKKQSNNFVSSDNIYYGENQVPMQQTLDNMQGVKDDNYQNTFAQEEQVEFLKNSIKNDEENNENKDQSIGDFFDENVDLTKFNLKDGQNSFIGSHNIENENIIVKGNVTVQRNVTQTNQNNLVNKNLANSNMAGKFFSETGNASRLNENVDKNDNLKSSNLNQKVEKPTRLNNGLIDFSSLTDDE